VRKLTAGTTGTTDIGILLRPALALIRPGRAASIVARTVREDGDNADVDVTAKLQIKPGQRVAALAAAADVPAVTVDAANPPAAAEAADVVVAFARNRAELDAIAGPAIDAARRDRLAWIAYPKAGKLGTDLNRDILAAALADQGIQPVRQVAIDETWSALRFRPA
jgi:hypothetical protein